MGDTQVVHCAAMLRTLLIGATLWLACGPMVHGTVLSVGEMESCEHRAGAYGQAGKLTCHDKFMLALSVQNNQVR